MDEQNLLNSLLFLQLYFVNTVHNNVVNAESKRHLHSHSVQSWQNSSVESSDSISPHNIFRNNKRARTSSSLHSRLHYIYWIIAQNTRGSRDSSECTNLKIISLITVKIFLDFHSPRALGLFYDYLRLCRTCEVSPSR